MKMLRVILALLLLATPVHAQGVGQLGSGQLWGNSTASRAPAAPTTVTGIVDRAISSTQGAVLTRQGSAWVGLAPGTAGLPLLSGGAAANLAYGILGLAGGGTNANLTASNGGLFYSTGTAGAILAGTATAGQIPRSGSSAAPSWSTATFPATAAAGTVLGASSANVIAATATPVLGVAGSTVGSIGFANATSGSVTVQPATGALGTAVWSLPAATDTFVGKATTDTLTNKTLNSPTLTGTPVAPTAAPGTNTTQIATTAFVAGAAFPSAANPTGLIGMSAVNGSAITFTRTDSTHAIDPAIAPTWTGNHTFKGRTLFGSPQAAPYVDVESGSNGCAAAVGNGSTNDQPAIQCQIDFLCANIGGGNLYFHVGKNYSIGSTVTVKCGVWLVGADRWSVSITTSGDFNAVTFDSSSYGGLRHIAIVGSQSTSAAAIVVTIADNRPITMGHCLIWGGATALSTAGADGYVTDCYIQSSNTTSGVAVASTGANWYVRVKMDNGAAAFAAFVQNTSGLTTAENTFVECDFSGPYTYSVQIADVAAFTMFSASIFSAQINISAAQGTILNASRIGSTSLVANSAGELIISGSFAVSATSVTGTATRSCAANVRITC